MLDGAGGVYCEDCDVAPVASSAGPGIREDADACLKISPSIGVMPYAIDPGTAERLWSASELMAGVAVG